MKKLKYMVCGALLTMAAMFAGNINSTFAQEEYINGVLVTPQDYEDPEYHLYKNNQRSSFIDNDLSDKNTFGDNLLKNNTYDNYEDILFSMKPQVFYSSPYSKSTVSMLNKNTYIHNERFKDYEILEGIDVSKWQGDINWKKVKESGIDFVIIRAAYRSFKTGNIGIDPKFIKNIEGAKNAGIEHIGIYIFSQAATVEEGKEEAEYAVKLLKDYDIDMPIVMDVEYVDSEKGHFNKYIKKSTKTKICEAFCDTVIAAGYDAMIYSSKSFLENEKDGLYGDILSEKYGIWVAQWNNKNTYSYDYQLWQFSGDGGGGSVSGIEGVIDCDYWYYKSPQSSEGEEVKIKLSNSKINLSENNYKMLSATDEVTGKQLNVKWKSDNPAVAYVASTGKVVAVSKGTTTITAIADNGTEAKCVINVSQLLSDYKISNITDSRYTGKNITKKFNVFSKEKVPYEGTLKIDYAVIKKGPYSTFKNVKTLEKNDKFTILKKVTVQNKIWYAVKYTDENDMEYTGYVYGGKDGTQNVDVKSKYIILELDKNYNVSYKGNKLPGIATVTVTGIGNSYYYGTLKTTFVIYPGKVTNARLTKRGGYSLIVNWDKVAGASCYEIYRAQAYDGKYTKVATVGGNKFQYKDTKLEKGKCYYYKVRAIKKTGGQIFNGYLSDVVSTYTLSGKNQSSKITKTTYIYENAGATYKKIVKLQTNTKITNIVANTLDSKGNIWYYVTFKKSGKTYKGYIKASYLSSTMKGKVTCNSLNVRNGRGTDFTILKTIKKGTTVKILDENDGWYKIIVTINGVAKKGYVKKTYIKVL